MLDSEALPSIVELLSDAKLSLSKRCLCGFLTAIFIGWCIARPMIRWLSLHKIVQVLRTRQQVRELAVLHGSKEDTPTMGAIIILIASIASTLIWASLNDFIMVTLSVYLACTLVGALDDLLKISRINTVGVRGWQKLALLAVIVFILFSVVPHSSRIGNILTHVNWRWFNAMFSRQAAVIIVAIFCFFVIAGTSNAVNITDGVDGLAIANIMQCLVFFMVIAFYSCGPTAGRHPLITRIAGASEMAVMCACFTGGCAVFALFNAHPASVFMGDMGSIGLGGLLAIVAILLRQHFSLLIVGIIFVVEVLSVIIQMTSKKFFKKKIFLMSPIHHHFELKGYSEPKIVGAAFAIQIFCVLAALLVILCL
ncbi:MAG: phospho-N-acetylmuramoyl-pentapeptide-transferase [Puniceicoccales bacterium]|jgi:phospho-N-acetylmuramoyl-pentapeptide-transferase|nr:phospho-N-acetylmuramoyl-pentapeptide-transferase [Puniceicoccales bacterium]